MPPVDMLRARLAAALGDRYTLERELTGGGMARVFVALERELERRVVIKTLAPELAAGLSAERFDREIRVVAGLQHPNIVGVLTSGAVDSVPWFAMPFVEGDSLRARLLRGALPEADAVGILRDVARALAYAHDRGIVHRDIKPDNILLADEAAVVTDFGIAKAVTAARTQAEVTPETGAAITSAGISLGTPAYMAPEQAAADANVDRRADLYALGCVAHELVSGHPPFAGASAAELLRAHLLTPPPAIPAAAGVSRGYAALVARCLAKDPAQRPASARDVLRALEQLAGAGEATAAGGGLLPALAVWAATLGATYLLARAAVVGIGLPDFTVAWATGAAALGLPVVLATWWVKRTARHAQVATPTRTPGGTLTQTTLAGIALKASPYATWRRARRAGLLAVGGVAMLVAGVMVLRQFGVGPVASLAGTGRVRGNERLMVAQFVATTPDPGLGEELTQAMRDALSASSALQVLAVDEIGRALRRMARDPGTPLTPEVARELAQREGIPLVVTGKVTGVGSEFLVRVTLETADSGAVLATLQRGARGADDLLQTMDWLARRLRERVGESLRTVNRTPALAQVTTASLPALRAFSRGAQLGDAQGDFARALPYLMEATRLDSTFASAWRKAAAYAWNSGRPRSEVFRYAREAWRHRDRASPQEQVEITGYYLSQLDTRRALAVYLADTARDASLLSAANRMLQLGRVSGADSLLVRLAQRDSAANRTPIVQYFSNAASIQLLAGRPREARKTLDELRRRAPEGSSAVLLTLYAGWLDGQVDGLDRAVLAQQVLPGSRLASSLAGMRAVVYGSRGQLRAFDAEARNAGVRASNLDLTIADTLESALWTVVTAAVHQNEAGRGVARLDSLRRAHPQEGRAPLDRQDPQLATAYAQLGRPDLARSILAAYLGTLGADERLATWYAWRVAQGEIALAEGRTDEAIEAFHSATSADSGQLDAGWAGRLSARLARAYDRAGVADSARVYYTRVADGMRDPALAPLMLPIALRRLGELAEARGDAPEAIRRYRAFAVLWREADPELQPQVADVRRRIAALEAREARGR